MDELFSVKKKVVLITGSSGGLGYVFARGLASRGAKVVINGTNIEKLYETQRSLKEQGFETHAIPFDVTDADAVKEAMEKIDGEAGPIDVLVNNAGINLRAPAEEMDESTWDKVININLKGAFLVSRAAGKQMIKNKRGKIINICSMQSELGRATISPYAASKGGLKMLTKNLAVEWAKHNIQVNGIGPGYFKTEMTKALYENKEFDDWLKSRTPANRWGDPEELVGALVYLSSEASNYLNGQIIYVDGGLLSAV
ncbi:MAG: SDR family NAD(P)-dependent oxidoreductase [Bacteroidota bacterium]